MSKEIQDCIGITLLCSSDWCRKLMPLFQPVRFRNQTMKDLFPFSQHISTTHFPYFFQDGEITRQISILFFSRIEVFVSTLVHYLFMVRYRNSIAKSEGTENVALFFSFKTTGKNRFWPCFANTKNFMKQRVKPLLFTGLFFIIKRQGEGKAKGTYKSLP